jgi:Ca2+-transporting ATPase
MPVPAHNKVHWCKMTSNQVAQVLEVDPALGLSTVEAQARLQRYAPNSLSPSKTSLTSFAGKHLYPLGLPLTLLVAAYFGLLFALEILEISVFLVMVTLALCSIFLIVFWGLPLEVKSARLENEVLVRRDGLLTLIDVKSVVPGDIAILTPGSVVPADGRLWFADRLTIGEMALMGSDNFVYMNTTVSHGYGAMIVTGTGLQTEIGPSLIPQANRTQANQSEQEALAPTMPKGADRFSLLEVYLKAAAGF